MKLPKAVAFSLTCLGGAVPAWSQGTLANLANSIGATIFPLYTPEFALKGPDFRVEVFLYDVSKEAGFGRQLGGAGLFDAKGVFNAGSTIVPGTLPGDTASFVVRAWDVRTGATFDAARVKGI